jgi:copper chaperone
MQLLVDGLRCGDCVRAITDAVLGIDVGARINVDAPSRHVRIAGRMSLQQARDAIEARGFRIESVLDRTLEDAIWKGPRPSLPYF